MNGFPFFVEAIDKAVFKARQLFSDYKYREILGRSTNSRIVAGVKINNPSNFFLGDNSYINGGSYTTGSNSTITIGNNCLISYDVFMRTVTHQYLDRNTPINQQGHAEDSIVVEDDVWIGNGAMIAGGVTLHKGCVVGMGAVVTRDVPEYTVVAGCPARKIKVRS